MYNLAIYREIDSKTNVRKLIIELIKMIKVFKSQQAHHDGQMTSKQCYINVDSVGTMLFRGRLTMMSSLGICTERRQGNKI